jgi:prepilin-type N-terminal cleavage/methylation domain-containing protein
VTSTPGFTLLELITVITLLGLLLGRTLPAGRRLQDRMAVIGAREAVVGLFHRARSEAIARGGATLALTVEPSGVRLLTGTTTLEEEDLEGGYGVSLGLSRGRKEGTLTFDALGLGRVSSLTLVFSRGDASAQLVISSYGRITRQ